MPSAELAESPDVRDVPAEELRFAQLLWATVDSLWIHVADHDKFMSTVEPVRQMDPTVILSTHLPPVVEDTASCLEMLQVVPLADPYVGPDQRALEEMLAGFEPTAAADTPVAD